MVVTVLGHKVPLRLDFRFMVFLATTVNSYGEQTFAASPLLLSSFLKNICLFVCLFVCSCLQTHQKRASDPITDGYESPCGCWELNSGPSEEQSVLLTAEPSLQTFSCLSSCFKLIICMCFPEEANPCTGTVGLYTHGMDSSEGVG